MSRRSALLFFIMLALSAPAAAQNGDAGVALVRCGPGGEGACLQLRTVLPPPQAGTLAPVERADGGWRMRYAGAEVPGRPAAVPAEAQPPLRLLVLVDVSGSMKDGGLQAARSALRAFLKDDLPANSVRVAVVPFASARVAERIREARFVPAPQAASQVDALPAPDGNTALYSAVVAGLERLAAEPAPGDTAWNALLVVTDGRNDVGRRGDDPGLLAGDAGRARAVEAVRASGAYAWVVGIGPGPETAELRALARPRGQAFVVAQDPVALRRALEGIKGWIYTGREFLLPVGGSAQARLAAGPARAAARAGEVEAGGAWVPPVFALPAFQGRSAGRVEGVSGADPWRPRRVAVLAFFAGVLLILWTAVPPLLRAPVPVPRPAFQPQVPRPMEGAPAGRRRIRLRAEGGAIPVAGTAAVAVVAADGLRSGVTEAPPRRPTDVTAKVSRPMQRA